jgi:hypothetical protein
VTPGNRASGTSFSIAASPMEMDALTAIIAAKPGVASRFAVRRSTPRV